jgi:hypothetical protein
VYVVDIKDQTVISRSLTDESSGLTQHQIDLLSVTSPQFYTSHETLYISGGYGVDTESGLFSTKDCLTAIHIPGLVKWVEDTDESSHSPVILSNYINQIFDPIFQVTGGLMTRSGHHDTLLIFGQNFAGYYVPETSGQYTKQIRKFRIHETNGELTVDIKPSGKKHEYYRRRDLNIVPVITGKMGFYEPSYVAFSGVFTLTGGAWTVPVKIGPDGSAEMEDPNDPDTFKQGMNNYACANVGLFSGRHSNMYTILFGGISFGFFSNGVFTTDPELPFINQVTTIKLDKHGRFTQYLMDSEYPIIISTGSNPGNQLLFGAGAGFMSSKKVDTFSNSVIKLDHISHKKSVVIGYIVGGIQSTVPNTSGASDSAASPYIFKVTLTKIDHDHD